ncbi:MULTISPECIES: methyl-accepting chemotaxis protein [unclassified Devosia]|jgi:methyl-accepting chemotaxis protein|uniref:methyl-accepting chemotaxis protein n=1 Tax=unclassified Devosia TaxID=196773 RepID=UPI0023D7CA9F|nr:MULTISPECIES: methyl-accepting chemotaxis protein [unclassified Devosia]WEJ33664.1 methyl-accepting chemotaxis protein [Devosia sp. SD17-2]
MHLLPRLNIAKKLPLALMGTALIVSAGVGIASYLIGQSTVLEQREQSMQAALHTGATMITDYYRDVEVDLRLFVERADTVTAMKNLDRGLSELRMGMGDRASEILQKAYVTDNPNPAARDELDSTNGQAGTYDAPHKRYHPGFRTLMHERRYSDVLLLNLAGDVVYSVVKNTDFAANVGSGAPLSASGLGQAFALGKDLEPNAAGFVDFTSYAPGGQALSFMAMPVFEKENRLGVMVLAISPAAVSERVSALSGLGGSGEVVVVGKDDLLRTETPRTEAGDVLVTTLTSDAVVAAFAGQPSEGMSHDFRDETMLVRALKVNVGAVEWAIVAAQPEAEANAPVTDMRNMILAMAAALLAIAALVGYFFARSISRPISRLNGTMQALAEGDLDIEVDGTGRSDEIGAMARTVEVFRENGLKVAQMTEAEAATIIANQEERARMMLQLQRAFGVVVDAAIAGDFGRRVDMNFPDDELNRLARSVNELVETVDRGIGETGAVLSALAHTDLTQRVEGEYQGAFARLRDDTNAVADKLSQVISDLQQTSGTLKTATGEILSGANDLSERTTKQAATIEETSAAMEQLALTVMENAKRAQDASGTADEVTRSAEDGGRVMAEANLAMERITQSSAKISNIIGMIDDIAFQTNLLALNASVEAARAGEAGKGFAVVAVEVRRLAQSAASASSDVKQLIEQSALEVKGGSRLVADAAGKLETMLQAARASNAQMGDIARESREQAASIDEVNSAVRQMDEMTQHNAALVEEMNAAIEQTEAQANKLDTIVEVFTVREQSVRAEGKTRPLAALAEGARGLQDKLKTATRAYFTTGNAAIKDDWSDF